MQAKPVLKPVLGRNRDESVAVEDDVWCWGVIFTAAAFAALCVAILFSIGTLGGLRNADILRGWVLLGNSEDGTLGAKTMRRGLGRAGQPAR